ncbi:flavodoxin domain-containing protein [Roseibacillus persicicus]|uniref:flavodoxin domain-containing protein n=1 Tax=Roseibacillus persicicus TaxID=454148 RepID=UPI00280DCDA9|nr:flavodoxin domain-containing protein [Roseibacillus persicicus]MDQ8192027.1 flavodoxin domain-containing protein [Roseibacillus persicicus]
MIALPPNAPFTPEQIGWLNGYLAARMQVQQAPGTGQAPPAQSAPAPAGKAVHILWGSQTGTSEGLAKKTAKTLTAAGHQTTVTDMADSDAQKLVEAEYLLVITSTYGDGEPPDNAVELHELLHADDAPSFAKTNFAVVGLGDSEYPDFNQCAKEFDAVLEKLGGQRLCPRVDCDVDYDDPFDQWLAQVSESLAKAAEAAAA